MGEEGRVSPSRGLLALSRPCLQRHVGYDQQVRARCAARGLHGHALRYGHDIARECCSIGICCKIAFGLGALEALAERLLSIGPALAQFLLDGFAASPQVSAPCTARHPAGLHGSVRDSAAHLSNRSTTALAVGSQALRGEPRLDLSRRNDQERDEIAPLCCRTLRRGSAG